MANGSALETRPRAVNGLMDLSHADFSQKQMYVLEGDWQVYWDQLVEPEKLPEVKPDGNFRVPGFWYYNRSHYLSWFGLDDDDSPRKSSDGYATFVVKVHLPKAGARYGLFIPYQGSSYKLQVVSDKHLVLSQTEGGKVGKNAQEARPYNRAEIALFSAESQEVTLILQISNYHHSTGGPWLALKIGEAKAVYSQYHRNLFIDGFLVSISILIGIYQLGIWSLRRRDPAPLYFGIFCILLGLRVGTSDNTFVQWYFEWLPWEFTYKFTYLTIFLMLPVLSIWVGKAFRKYCPLFINKYIDKICFLLAALTVLTPANIYTLTLPLLQVIAIFYIFMSYFVLIRAAIARVEESYVFLAGFLVLGACGINDVLYYNGVVQTGVWMNVGTIAFMLSQTAYFSIQFGRAYTEIAILTKQLGVLNQDLERQVQDRTKDLLAKTGELEAANIQLTTLATTDGLTNVLNRRALNEVGAKCYGAARSSGADLSVIIIDADKFKRINDTFGHGVGDEVIKIMAEIGRREVRRHDHLGRFGGEEFVAILPDTTLIQAVEIAERLRTAIENCQVPTELGPLQFTISVGVATISPEINSYDDLLHRADEALYAAKEQGRNRVCYI